MYRTESWLSPIVVGKSTSVYTTCIICMMCTRSHVRKDVIAVIETLLNVSESVPRTKPCESLVLRSLWRCGHYEQSQISLVYTKCVRMYRAIVKAIRLNHNESSCDAVAHNNFDWQKKNKKKKIEIKNIFGPHTTVKRLQNLHKTLRTWNRSDIRVHFKKKKKK